MIIHKEGWLEQMNWWSDPNHPNAFTYANLDEYYPKEYIESARMPSHVVDAYVKYVQEYYHKIAGGALKSVVEAGCAGGWFLKAFKEKGVKVLGLEGSLSGVEACVEAGLVRPFEISIFDLREPFNQFNFVERFDICISSECAEHVESPFAGTYVRNLIATSDLIWFSSEPPNTNQAHLHHCNEQVLKYWINLFDFLGYGCYLLPDHVHSETAERSRCIFYNKKIYNP